LKIELLRTWYGLSDGEVEDQVNDRLSFSRFAGIGLENDVPDSTTVCRFRNILVEAGLYDNILDEINRQLEAAHVLVRHGVIVDASVTDTPRRPRGRKELEIVEDRKEKANGLEAESTFVREKIKPNVDKEARWVKKMGKLHFGYKRHTVTDVNESDMKHMETPLRKARLPKGASVYADKGYDSAENREILKRMKLKSRIMHKANKSHKLTDRERRVNIAISKTRYRVERTFGSIHLWFSGGCARYVGLAKTHAQHIMESIAYNLYRAPRIIVTCHFQ
jgi:IS5 family transposase